MNFVDKTLVRLADTQTRLAVFNETSLEQIVAAAYDIQVLNVSGPYSAVFDELQPGFAIPRQGILEGAWSPPGGLERMEARFQVAGLGGRPNERIEAWWRGGIVARVAPSSDRITQVQTTLPSLGSIDQAIIANLGALPSDPGLLEQERRARLLSLIQSGFELPEAFPPTALEEWLDQMGAASVSDLLEHFAGSVQPATLKIAYSPPANPPSSPRLLPISALILVRDANLSVAELLSESKAILEMAEELGLEAQPDPELRPRLRRPVVVVWVVPLSLFDDNDWPGGTSASAAARREARRARASQWLAGQGIGLAAL